MPTAPITASEPPSASFSPEQKEYLAGFMAGISASGLVPFVGQTSSGLLTDTPAPGATTNLAAARFFSTPVEDLCREERWKYDENPLDAWDRLIQHADADRKPDAEHTYRFKFFGLFHVAPAQDSFMLRLRLPACELTSAQLHGLADLAADLGGGYADITTRGSLQIREFKPRDIIKVLTRVQDLGLTSRGSGADNIRNVTASPNSGFDPDEILDVRPYAKALHHYILNHRDLYGLPRKFNVAFDNGGSLSVAADTNDIGFIAARARADAETQDPGPRTLNPDASGVRFRVLLGGITGHKDFARDTGLFIKPSEAVAVAAAMIRVFNEHGDRTDRKKARLKYVLDRWGFDRFLAATQEKLAFPLHRAPLDACEPRRPVVKHGWLGVWRQSQRGLNSVGLGVPAGRLTVRQMRALADLASHYAKSELRLTAWQSVIIPHVPEAFASSVARRLQQIGLHTEASAAGGGIIACTGSRGCKYAGADTKGHALALHRHLRTHALNEAPLNIHFTGCAHSCAQHYCGDLGFIGTKLADGTEGYHVVIGGGMDHEQGIARELLRGVRASEINPLVERIVGVFQTRRERGESFVAWARRHEIGKLQELLS